MHRIDGRSGDQIRFVKAPPQPKDDRRTALGEHTDFGSVTVLFNRLGGLQVLPPGRDAQWCYVKPLDGHAIINLGDAMVKFTNGLLRSNIHRVSAPPGEQADYNRFSLVYFNRPEVRTSGETRLITFHPFTQCCKCMIYFPQASASNGQASSVFLTSRKGFIP
jgi:isopenicillin N synthase-like dioxygenase